MAEQKLRTVNKQEAIQRLIHAAIRSIIVEEDPLPTHLLIQSGDKMLIDVAAKLGKELRVDWELYIKDEFHGAFFERHRSIYNYLKHADRDFDKDLVVEDIVTRNLMDLYVLIANYSTLYREKTSHMVLFQIFILQLYPEIIIPPDNLKEVFKQNAQESWNLTPRDFLKVICESDILPNYYLERFKDHELLGDFYSLTFGEHRTGVKVNPRKFTIPVR